MNNYLATFILLSCFTIVNAFAGKLQHGIYTYNSVDEAAKDTLSTRPWALAKPSAHAKEYRVANDILEPLYAALCEKYSKCNEFPMPKLILSYINNTGAFAKEYQGKVHQTNAIILSKELLSDKEQLEFVLAHEMIHYFEEHGTQITLAEQISAIKVQGKDKCLDFDEPAEIVEGNLIQLISLVDELGNRPQMVSIQAALPLDGGLGNVLERMLYKSYAKHPSCLNARSLFYKLKADYNRGLFISIYEKRYREFKKSADECFSSYKGNLLRDSLDQESLFTDLNPSLWPAIDKIIKNDNDSELVRLQNLRNIRYKEFTRLSRELSAPLLRYQSHEDIADVKAIEILLELGREDVSERLDYLLADLSSLEQIRCQDDLKNDREPNYGALNQIHHNECWRKWRAQKVEQRYQE